MSTKKQDKAEAKLAKKDRKAELKAGKNGPPPAAGPSPAVRYAEIVRGGLYVLTGASLVVALILGRRGVIISLDDLVQNLAAARGGELLLVAIGLAFVIYGLKHLRLIR